MCVIAYKPKGVKMPSEKELDKMWDTNPHGAGYMFADKGKVFIKKGFMTYDKFLYSLQADMKTHGEDIPYVLHFRITTHGTTTPGNTHPFVFTKDIKQMLRTKNICDMAIAHNGIITLEKTKAIKTGEYSDTQVFIAEYLTKLIRDKDFYNDTSILEMIKELAGSKLAIMDGTGHTTLIGEFTELDGVMYSNMLHTYTYDKWNDSYGHYDYVTMTAKVDMFMTNAGKIIKLATIYGYITEDGRFHSWETEFNKDIWEGYLDTLEEEK